MNQNNQEKESIDLSGMLKKTDSGDKPQASWQQPGVYVSPFAPKIIQKIVRYSGGLIKNERQAYYVLLGFVAVAIVITLFLIFSGTEFTPRESPPGLQLSPEF